MESKDVQVIKPYQEDDEIDLFELFSSLGQQWRWVVGITVIGVLLSIAIALMLPKQYELSAKVTLPDISTAMELHDKGYSKQTDNRDVDREAEKVFLKYYNMLNSRVVFNQFLQEGSWVEKLYPSGIKGLSLSFMQSKIKEELSIEVIVPKQPKKGAALPPRVIELKMTGIGEELITMFVNDYINYVGVLALTELKKSGKKLSNLEALKIRKEMDLLRDQEKLSRKARITRLREALVIAKQVGMEKPDTVRLYSEANEGDLGGVTASALSEGLFLMGSKYLTVEIELLQKRVSGDSFIDGFLDLEKRLKELDLMTFDFSELKPYRVIKVAEADGKAEKPKRALIVAVGSILAFFVAVFVALIMGAVKRRKEA